MLSNTIAEGKNKDLENKILELEVQKDTTNRQAEEINSWVIELEAKNNSLEIQLKTANERHIDIIPFWEKALLIRRKIYQVQLKLAEEVYKIK